MSITLSFDLRRIGTRAAVPVGHVGVAGDEVAARVAAEVAVRGLTGEGIRAWGRYKVHRLWMFCIGFHLPGGMVTMSREWHWLLRGD